MSSYEPWFKPRSNYEKLVERYADGKQLCNCRQAYYTNCGHGYKDGIDRTDLPTCQHGCSSNQITATEYIADKICEEFKI